MALAHGHAPDVIDEMPVKDLELLATYASAPSAGGVFVND